MTTKVAILATLLVLTPLYATLPYPVLAGVVIAAVLSFIDVPAFRRLLRFQRAAQRSKGPSGRDRAAWAPCSRPARSSRHRRYGAKR